MKPLREWDEDYLLGLTPDEFSDFEVKGRRACDLSLDPGCGEGLKKLLGKAVSAFANTNGGYLVLGLKDPVPGQPLEVDDGGIELRTKGRQRYTDWLNNLVVASVEPVPAFEVRQIDGQAGTSQIESGRSVVVIEVPRSEHRPHQSVPDRVYYQRTSKSSIPLPHGLVADMFNRRRDPLVECVISVADNGTETRHVDAEGVWRARPRYELQVLVANVGQVYASYVVFWCYVPLEMCVLRTRLGNAVPLVERGGVQYYECHGESLVPDGDAASSISHHSPILPKLSQRHLYPILEVGTSRSEARSRSLAVTWDCYADSAPPRHGVVLVADVLASVPDLG